MNNDIKAGLITIALILFIAMIIIFPQTVGLFVIVITIGGMFFLVRAILNETANEY